MGYDHRYVLLFLVNLLIRSYFGVFFTDFTESTTSLWKAALLCLFVLCFLFTRIEHVGHNNHGNDLPITSRRHAHEGGGGLLFRLRFGRAEMASPLLTATFVFSLICPTPLFLCALSLIILSLLCPTFFLWFIRPLLHRLSRAFSSFVSSPSAHSSSPQSYPDDEEDGQARRILINQNAASTSSGPASPSPTVPLQMYTGAEDE